MQKTIGDEAEPIFRSLNGDFSRPNRFVFTVVGEGTLYCDTNADVTPETGVPFAEGTYGSDDYFRSGETIWGVTETGTVDVRFMAFGARLDTDSED